MNVYGAAGPSSRPHCCVYIKRFANMSLLPKSEVEFADVEYWNKFFKKRGTKEFEWYGEYVELCGELHKYVKPKDNILVIGCGNSRLSSDLYDVGYRKMTNIDLSSVVIKQMTNHIGRDRPEMAFQQMDALNMTFEDGQFTVVLDKGTLDALMPEDTEEDVTRARQLFSQVYKVLKIGGRYIIISLLQEHILKVILEYFTEVGWMIRILRCQEVEKRTLEESGQLTMPVFFIVCTKFMKMGNIESVLEINLFGDEKVQRVKSKEEIAKMVQGVQKTVAASWRREEEEEMEVEFCREGETKPRYSIHIVDGNRDLRLIKKYGAFIVPLGRETDWLFGSKDGRSYLQTSSGFDRLAVISLRRDQEYGTTNDIQDELRQTILQFVPCCMVNNGKGPQIPYLTLGDGIGHRNTIHRATSALSGELVVEEVEVEGDTYRRLIFLSNQAVVQTEVRLKTERTKKKASLVIDMNHIASNHISYMSAAVALIDKKEPISVAVVGLGGGALCMVLRKVFPTANITGVEIDPIIFELAQEYFGLQVDEQLKVEIADGVRFVAEQRPFDVLMFDVDSKLKGAVVSCPPPEFLEPSMLESVKASIGKTGVFVTNVVCRVKKVNDEIIKKLRQHFRLVCWYNLQEDVNRIVFATNIKDLTAQQWREKLKDAAVFLNSNAKKKMKRKDSILNLQHLMNELTV